MRLELVPLVLCLSVSAALCKKVDIVNMRDGTYYEGSVVAQDSGSITIEAKGGIIRRIPLPEVKEVQLKVQPIEKGYHKHDGFSFSMDVGRGLAFDKWNRSNSNGSGTLYVSGRTLDFLDFNIGIAVMENLILSLDNLGGLIYSVPRNSGNGRNVNGLGATSQPDSVYGESLIGAGLGVTYYFMPQNVFLSGTLGFGSLSMDHRYGTVYEGSFLEGFWRHSDASGFLLRLKTGKEWWVSRNWGLGVSAAYTIFKGKEEKGDSEDSFYSVDPSYKGSITSQRISLMLNATFN